MYSRYNTKRRNLIIICLLLLVLIIPLSRLARKLIHSGEQYLKASIETGRADSTRVADSLKRALTFKKNFNKTLTDTLLSMETKNLAGGGPGVSYYIIIGSYASPGNAETVAEQYQNQGYETTIIATINRKGENISMVSVSSFSNADKAKSFLKEFQQKVNPNAWLYSN